MLLLLGAGKAHQPCAQRPQHRLPRGPAQHCAARHAGKAPALYYSHQVTTRSTDWSSLQIRTQLAKEMTQDLSAVAEENAHLMRETIAASFSLDTVASSPFE